MATIPCRTDGGADAKVEGVPHHDRAGRGRQPRRVVRGAVVDDENVSVDVSADALYDIGDGGGFVERWNDDEQPRGGRHSHDTAPLSRSFAVRPYYLARCSPQAGLPT